MAPLRPGLTPVRRAVGLVAVLFILSCAVVFYRLAPDLSTSGSSPRTTANSSASPATTRVGTQSATPGGESPNADPSRASDRSTTTTTPGANGSTGAASDQEAIQVDGSAFSARPFQTVRIQGTYAAGTDTFVQVQRLEESRWLAFPLPAKTDQSGRFTLYVELAQPGRYWLRVLDPVSGRTSKPFVLVIKG
jgi:hypothetical protein